MQVDDGLFMVRLHCRLWIEQRLDSETSLPVVMVSAASLASEDEPDDPAHRVTGVEALGVGSMTANVIVANRIARPTTSW